VLVVAGAVGILAAVHGGGKTPATGTTTAPATTASGTSGGTTTVPGTSQAPATSVPGTTTLAVTVTSTDGGVTSGITVTVTSPTGASGQIVTGAGGRANIVVHNSGDYTVSITVPSGYSVVGPTTQTIAVSGAGGTVPVSFTVRAPASATSTTLASGTSTATTSSTAATTTTTLPPSSGSADLGSSYDQMSDASGTMKISVTLPDGLAAANVPVSVAHLPSGCTASPSSGSTDAEGYWSVTGSCTNYFEFASLLGGTTFTAPSGDHVNGPSTAMTFYAGTVHVEATDANGTQWAHLEVTASFAPYGGQGCSFPSGATQLTGSSGEATIPWECHSSTFYGAVEITSYLDGHANGSEEVSIEQ
jgi:hypothetical protein